MSAPPKKAFPLRLDPALYAAIERAAASDLRSVNAQVECLLREALGRRGVKLADPVRPRRGRPPRQSAPETKEGE
ncbi:toxin-antitoxin system HicB family antitoxin [Sphingomonas psychrotolerans]|uniref:Toxin-antitoxin system HicB family antitoxin n=1 Tax=Sphingomonas psychrotolerans TaxID=1327635 RepID=A0A2K8MIR9_9SPHN|nr:toxin-antitoxin system HicB family antitoxin [Sphingomonas psychrotolerans]ATY33767.1 toxin-antitoxin system HicB family antitoxin [Sphingomonas psychrotolerans]